MENKDEYLYWLDSKLEFCEQKEDAAIEQEQKQFWADCKNIYRICRQKYLSDKLPAPATGEPNEFFEKMKAQYKAGITPVREVAFYIDKKYTLEQYYEIVSQVVDGTYPAIGAIATKTKEEIIKRGPWYLVQIGSGSEQVGREAMLRENVLDAMEEYAQRQRAPAIEGKEEGTISGEKWLEHHYAKNPNWEQEKAKRDEALKFRFTDEQVGEHISEINAPLLAPTPPAGADWEKMSDSDKRHMVIGPDIDPEPISMEDGSEGEKPAFPLNVPDEVFKEASISAYLSPEVCYDKGTSDAYIQGFCTAHARFSLAPAGAEGEGEIDRDGENN